MTMFPLIYSGTNYSKLGIRARDFTFCGSSLAMNLPIPCRPVSKGFDFGVQYQSATAGPSIYTSANSGSWGCQGATNANSASSPSYVPQSVQSLVESTFSSRMSRSLIPSKLLNFKFAKDSNKLDSKRTVAHLDGTEGTAGARSKNLTTSSKLFLSSKDEFIMEIYPVYKTEDNNPCRYGRPPSTCYLACCDSAYSQSYFCQNSGQICY